MNKEDWQSKGAGHRQRLRDKFLEKGIDAFSDSDLLELMIALGTPRKDCKEPARAALLRFGSFPAVLEAPQEELEQVKGIGPKNVFAIHFIHAVARRYLGQRLQKKKYVHSSHEVGEYLLHTMRDLEHEIFKVIFLDATHGIITSETVAQGTITANTVYPREVIKLALKHNAAAIVVAHNHPSGSLQPSSEDIRLTRNLFLACSFMHIQLLDHLIIGRTRQPYSFADQGMMRRIRDECRAVI